MINKIIQGHALDVLPQLPAESVNCVVTSPPYWSLRDYGVDPVIWDGDKDCKHQWIKDKVAGDIRFRGENSIVGSERNLNIYPIKHRPNKTNPGKEGWYKDKGGLSKNPSQSSFCSLCGAWRGSLGLEPTFELYIKHLCDIFDEVKRVLRKDGTVFVNIGDSYAGSGKAGSNPEYQNRHVEFDKQSIHPERFGMPTNKINYPNKSLCLIPQRFVIEMVNRGWIAHNIIIWHKPNCMPESAKHRFTRDFEYLYFFSKNNKPLFWTNEKTLECVDKQPPGTKGIEGEDWEWIQCPRCKGKGNIKNKICPRCKGSKRVKYSFWSGHDYWFEQQFEKVKQCSIERLYRAVSNKHKWINGPNGQTKHTFCKPRPNRNYKRYEKSNAPHEFEGSNHLVSPFDPLKGRNKRCVWEIPTTSFPGAHFAVYPEGLIEIPIKAGCPEFICKKCGKARVKILEPTEEYKEYLGKGNLEEHHAGQETKTKFKVKANSEYKFRDYSDCGCNAGWESGVNLDPFMGAGTTALVALKQRKRFIGIEIKQEYINMAYKRIARVQQEIF